MNSTRLGLVVVCWSVCSLAFHCSLPIPQWNARVGTADGPDGPTDVQVLADFASGELPTREHPRPDGFGFHLSPGGQLEIADGVLMVHPDLDSLGRFQLWWTGPRRLGQQYIREAWRANSHRLRVRVPRTYAGNSYRNFSMGGYADQRTPRYANDYEPESHNMHNYFQYWVDWGESEWRELLLRDNFQHQRDDCHDGGGEAFLNHARLWPDHTRFYDQFDTGVSGARLGDAVRIERMEWFYENPKLAAFPQHSVRYAEPDSEAFHSLIVWNTHPSRTRRFRILVSGWSCLADWWLGWGNSGVSIRDTQENLITETPALAPGEGFAFGVSFRVPLAGRDGKPVEEGDEGLLRLSVVEEESEIDPYGYQRPNFASSVLPQAGLQGVGLVLETRAILEDPGFFLGEAPAIRDLRVAETGSTWADLAWSSPAARATDDERSDDPAALAYSIRYRREDADHLEWDELLWQDAVPVESLPPVYGPGVAQYYSLRGLQSGTCYSAALRVHDHWSWGGPIASAEFCTKP